MSVDPQDHVMQQTPPHTINTLSSVSSNILGIIKVLRVAARKSLWSLNDIVSRECFVSNKVWTVMFCKAAGWMRVLPAVRTEQFIVHTKRTFTVLTPFKN